MVSHDAYGLSSIRWKRYLYQSKYLCVSMQYVAVMLDLSQLKYVQYITKLNGKMKKKLNYRYWVVYIIVEILTVCTFYHTIVIRTH